MTIEAILNLVWLIVAVAGTWLWRFRWRVSRRSRGYTLRMEAVAVLCVLALLFPVISLTDDLHPEVIPVDSVSSKRNLCQLVAVGTHRGHAGTHSNHSSVFECVSDAPASGDSIFSDCTPITEVSRLIFRSTLRSDRAPPSLA